MKTAPKRSEGTMGRDSALPGSFGYVIPGRLAGMGRPIDSELPAVLGGLAMSSAGDLADSGVSYTDKQAAQQAVRGHALGADISIAVGLAAAGTGVLLMVLTGDDDGSTAAVTPVVGPGHAGAQLLVRFP